MMIEVFEAVTNKVSILSNERSAAYKIAQCFMEEGQISKTVLEAWAFQFLVLGNEYHWHKGAVVAYGDSLDAVVSRAGQLAVPLPQTDDILGFKSFTVGFAAVFPASLTLLAKIPDDAEVSFIYAGLDVLRACLCRPLCEWVRDPKEFFFDEENEQNIWWESAAVQAKTQRREYFELYKALLFRFLPSESLADYHYREILNLKIDCRPTPFRKDKRINWDPKILAELSAMVQASFGKHE